VKKDIRIGGLDGLRAAAIVSVLCLHAAIVSTRMPLIVRGPCLYGWAGVDLFFVLSGYLIGGQAFRVDNRMDVGGIVRFWLRRWFRTLPLYYFILFVYVAILPRFGIPFRDWNWRYLVMLQNYMPLQDFQQSWSLCIEEQFYLVFPILALIAARLRLKPWVWLVPALVSLMLRYVLVDPVADRVTAQYTVRFPIYTHMDGLSVGVFLAATRPVWCDFSSAARRIAATAGTVALLSGLALLRHPSAGGVESIGCYTLIAIGFGGFLVASADKTLLPVVRVPIEKVAIWSYGAYLWNNIAFPVLRPLSLPWPLNFGGFALPLLPAAITYALIEEPFLRIRGFVLSALESRLPRPEAKPVLEELPAKVIAQG
jgi:peptidoglycan/LPS O-acetylase OafA/YrhL